jgi:LPXTG-motif cell wall-anchored protein
MAVIIDYSNGQDLLYDYALQGELYDFCLLYTEDGREVEFCYNPCGGEEWDFGVIVDPGDEEDGGEVAVGGIVETIDLSGVGTTSNELSDGGTSGTNSAIAWAGLASGLAIAGAFLALRRRRAS